MNTLVKEFRNKANALPEGVYRTMQAGIFVGTVTLALINGSLSAVRIMQGDAADGIIAAANTSAVLYAGKGIIDTLRKRRNDNTVALLRKELNDNNSAEAFVALYEVKTGREFGIPTEGWGVPNYLEMAQDRGLFQ